MDVVLPVRAPEVHETRALCLRIAARLDRPIAEMQYRFGCELPSTPRLIQNGVEKNDLQNPHRL